MNRFSAAAAATIWGTGHPRADGGYDCYLAEHGRNEALGQDDRYGGLRSPWN